MRSGGGLGRPRARFFIHGRIPHVYRMEGQASSLSCEAACCLERTRPSASRTCCTLEVDFAWCASFLARLCQGMLLAGARPGTLGRGTAIDAFKPRGLQPCPCSLSPCVRPFPEVFECCLVGVDGCYCFGRVGPCTRRLVPGCPDDMKLLAAGRPACHTGFLLKRWVVVGNISCSANACRAV